MFSSLRYGGLSQNNLQSIPPKLGESAPNLYVLDYGDNALTELPRIPSNLRQIYITGNNITKITTGPLKNATKLYELFLKGNKITNIEEGSFKYSRQIGWLDLSVSTFKFTVNNYLITITCE